MQPIKHILFLYCYHNNLNTIFIPAVSLRIMSAVVSPMVRSLLSKIIPHAEIGQIFAFGISLESLIAMTAGPMYTIIYTNSINVFPGAFVLIPFSLHIINLLLFM